MKGDCLTCSENRAETGLWSLMVKPMWLMYTCCVTLVAPPNHEVRPRCNDALWVGTGEPVRRRRQRIRSVQAGFLFLALKEVQQKKTKNKQMLKVSETTWTFPLFIYFEKKLQEWVCEWTWCHKCECRHQTYRWVGNWVVPPWTPPGWILCF